MHSRYGLGAAASLLAALLVCGRAQRGVAQVPASGGQPIVAIEFDCAAPIDRQGLQRLMPMRVGAPLRADDLAVARARLMATDIFTAVEIEPQPRGGGVAVVAHLVRMGIVNSISFRGNDAVGDDALFRIARVYEGAPLSDKLRDEALTRIRERYEAEGFPRVHVDAVVHARAPGEVDVTFRIVEGEPLRVAAVEIEGDVTLPSGEIRRALSIHAGDRYAPARRRAAQSAVIRLFRNAGYYEVRVEIRWEPRAENTGVLHVEIVQGPPFLIEFEGNSHFSDKHLLGLMDLPKRPLISDGTWRELARRAQRAYQEAGYYFARVDLHIEPGPPKVVRFAIHEDRPFRVGAVTFEGNHSLSSRLLRAQMATRPPSWIPWRRGIFLDDVFDDDLKRLWFFYRRYGFESAEIVDARKTVDRQRGTISVAVVVEEGRRTIVRSIERVGLEPIAAKLPTFRVTAGAPLDPDQVEADRQALMTAFTQAGYTAATVTVDVRTHPEGATEAAVVRFTAAPGDQRRVGTIIVQNNFDTRSRVILRALPVHPGDPLDPAALLRGQSDVYRLGLFRSVTVRPLEGVAPEAGPGQDIAVKVSEKPPGTFQWGAGYNTRDGLRGFGEIGYANLQGLARSLSFRGDLSLDPNTFNPNDYIASLSFREPHVGDTRWTFRNNIVAQRSTRNVDQFSLERVAVIPAIERTLLPTLQVGFEAQVEQARVFDVAPDVLAFNPRDQGQLRTVSVGPFVVHDGRDDPFVPRRGVFESLRLRYAPGALGSQVPFVALTGEHSQYVPLVDDLIFVYAARGGWALAYQHGDQVPIRDRFFLGGRTTVRGFGENEIGPIGSIITDSYGQAVVSGNPTGGDMALNLNTELRFPLAFGLGGAVFVDGGGVYLQDRAISIDDFRRSAGLGLRYITPVGPLSLEYGFKLDRRPGESVGEIHFSIGNIF
jgi:outer membrane protein insertion porin family